MKRFGLALASLAGGVGLSLFTFVAQPLNVSEEVRVQVSGDNFPVEVAGATITATNGLYKHNTSPEVVEKECGPRNSEASPPRSPDGRLLEDVLVVTSTDGGAICVPMGESRRLGNVEVAARNMGEIVRDGKGGAFTNPDGTDNYFRELGISTGSSIFRQVQLIAAGILLGIGGGLSVELVKESEWWRRQRTP